MPPQEPSPRPPPPAPPPPNPPEACGPGSRVAGNGCSECDRGKFQDQLYFNGFVCPDCPLGTYADREGATSCDECEKPICARSVEYCDAVSGQDLEFNKYSPEESAFLECNAPNPLDVCDDPEYCVPGEVICDPEPKRQALEINEANLCPHLLSTSSWNASRSKVACWEQEDTRTRREAQHYSTHLTEMSVVLPHTLYASCGRRPLHKLQFRYFFIVCPESGVDGVGGGTECSDAKLDCPSEVNAEHEWWTGMGALTLHASNVTTDSYYTAQFEPLYYEQTQMGLNGRTVHVVVHVRARENKPLALAT